MNFTASQDASKENTTIHARSPMSPTYRPPLANALAMLTECVSGKNHARVSTHFGIEVNGKNTPEKKNIGDTTRLK